MEPLSITVARDDAATARLGDAHFITEWEALLRACPWATSFQSPAFVECWYGLYSAAYEPVLVEGRDATGALVGLMPLARRRSGRTLVGAGDIHAEYQGWIATPEAAGPFVSAAISSLERGAADDGLRFNYLAPGTPVDVVTRGERWPRRVHVRARQRGAIDLSDAAGIEASLRKGHNRSRLNHLRRSGEVRLETIESADVLARAMDEIEVLCDLRQGAVNDSLPFRNDPLKRLLHMGLMERGLLLVTVLRVGDRVASVHLDMRNGPEVLIYLIAHAPAFARDSPGSLHILMLARDLASGGIARYDLSPGGGYKDRFATERDVVHRMAVRFGLRGRLVGDVSARAISVATIVLARSGRTPGSAWVEARTALHRCRRRLLRREPPMADAGHGDRAVQRLPTATAVEPVGALEPGAARVLVVDRISDLLAFDPSTAPGTTCGAFLRRALHRLERGQHVMTRTEDGVLVECWWAVALSVGSPLPAPGPSGRGASSVALLVYDDLPGMARGDKHGADSLAHGLAAAAEAIEPSVATYVATEDRTLAETLAAAGGEGVGEDLAVIGAIGEALDGSWPKDGPGSGVE